jgi:hypothetical protein
LPLFTAQLFFVTTKKAQAQFGRPLDGRPITASDLSGKKLCWDTGYWDIFAANGDYSNIRNPKPHMKWSVPEAGVVHTGTTYWQTEILPDGQYYLHRFSSGNAITGHFEHWAKV